jgi:DNA-directed RNA polymerase specialized sigma subunit
MTDRQQLQQQEMDLWKQWKRGDNEALGHLMKSMRPIVHQWTNRVSNTPLPKSYLEARVKRHMVDSMKAYDPTKGAKLSTFVNSRMKKVYRDVYPYQNVGHIPEHRVIKIQTFETAKQDLEDKFNREPTYMELSDELNWSLAEVERMDRELRADVPSTTLTEEYSFSDEGDTAEQLGYVYHSITPNAKLVFEHMFGYGGKKEMRAGEIQKKLKMNPSEYRRHREEIVRAIEQAM